MWSWGIKWEVDGGKVFRCMSLMSWIEMWIVYLWQYVRNCM